MVLQTEYEFTLPRGYIDQDGNLHRQGVMRLATALDEIIPLQDRRVRENQAYLAILLLARVVTKLGTLSSVTPTVIENLFAGDLAYLQALYRRINEEGVTLFQVTCPDCQKIIEVDLAGLGGEL
jgi:hypothetical protein